MEELQSTEILDREILEDARKKVQRILKATEDAIKANAVDWENKLKAALDELEKKYAEQGKLAVDEIMARLPLDKRRTKNRKIDELLHSAVETWYKGLGHERVRELLKRELGKRLVVCDKIVNANGKPATSSEIRACIHQLDKQEAQTILQEVLPGKSFVITEIHSASPFPEIILETQEARIYASIGKTVDFFLGEKRAELVEALLGEAAQMELAGEEL